MKNKRETVEDPLHVPALWTSQPYHQLTNVIHRAPVGVVSLVYSNQDRLTQLRAFDQKNC